MLKKSERGGCRRWITKGQCSYGDPYAFKREPSNKGKGKGRPRSPTPTGSPHRKSESDGRHTKMFWKCPSEKSNRRPCRNFKKGSCHEGNSCNYWHVPARTKFKAPGGGKFWDKCAYTHSIICWWEAMFTIDCSSHFIERWTTSETTEHAVGWQDAIPSDTPFLKRKIGTFIEWTLHMEEMTRKSAWALHKNSRFIFWEST